MRLDLSPDEARAIAEEAYLVAYPSVGSYWRFWTTTQDPGSPLRPALDRLILRRTPAQPGGIGEPGAEIPLPDPSTVSSAGWWDLRSEPLVLSTPTVGQGRYHAVRFADAGGRTFGTAGRRATGDEATTVVVAGPAWDGFRPATADDVVRAPTDLVEVSVHVGFDGPYDLPAANTVQEAYRVTPLSSWRGHSTPPSAAPIAWPRISRWILGGVPQLFEFFTFWADFAASDGEEPRQLERLSRLGLRPGTTWSPGSFTNTMAEAIEAGASAAHDRIAAWLIGVDRRVSGWVPHPRTGTDAADPRDDLARLGVAAAAMAGFDDDPEDVMTFLADVDAADEPLNAAASDYRLVLPGPVPTAHSWSVTVYVAETGTLADNEIDRYTLGSRHRHLYQTPGGSVSIRLGVEPPDRGGLGNWLPTPPAPFRVLLRLYQPRPEAVDGRWTPPPLERLPKATGLSRPDELRWPTLPP